MSSTFKHLIGENVVSRFFLESQRGFQSCAFSNCTGLVKDEVQQLSDFKFSEHGSFVTMRKNNCVVLMTDQQKFVFPINQGVYDVTEFVVSPCECFIALLYGRK